jgi:hypothetical protein
MLKNSWTIKVFNFATKKWSKGIIPMSLETAIAEAKRFNNVGAKVLPCPFNEPKKKYKIIKK